MAFISLRAYARHRNVRLSAVQKAIESRRLHGAAIRDEGGRLTGVDPEIADQQWSANTDPIEAERNGKHQASAAAVPALLTPPPGTAPDKPAEPAGEQGNFLAARTREAELRGELLQLDKLERIGELLPRAAVRAEFSEIFAQLKSGLLRIPDRKAQALAAETDPLRVNRVLSDELRTVLDEFSRQFTESAPGVADDAGVAGEHEKILP